MNNKVILIVEDESGIAGAVKVKLENEGFKVFVADSVEMATEIYEQNNVSFVWLDHYLRGTRTGLDFIAYVKDENKDIPVFVVTNTASSDERYSYLKLGADRYYVKTNYTLSELIEEVKAMMN
jgi:DNA-binding response OmpR family regulator